MDHAYPHTRRDNFSETIHERVVPDPYRWLEDTTSAETENWVKAQSDFTETYLARLPERETIRQRLTELSDYEKYGIPQSRDGRLFYTRNDGLQNQGVLYWLPEEHAAPIELLDPNRLSSDGTVALSDYSISYNGKLLAYGLASAGSDWKEYHIRQVDSGEDLPDVVRWAKFTSANWTPDNHGFYYSRYEVPDEASVLKDANYYQKLYYHQAGADQSSDRLVYQRPDQKEWGFTGLPTEDGRYLVIVVWQGTREETGLFYQDLTQPGSQVIEWFADFDAKYNPIANDGGQFYLFTDKNAPLRQVVRVDLSRPGSWETIVPEAVDALEAATVVGNRLFCVYLSDAHTLVKTFDLQGKPLAEVNLPGIGSAVGFWGTRHDHDTFFIYTDFTSPGQVFHYDLTSGEPRLLFRPKLTFHPEDYVTEQVFYPSKDGTRVPMALVHKKGLVKNGLNPTMLYGYGGFNISMTPYFNPMVLAWMELGGVYARANLRGGGEYGKAWHESGMRHQKQNVFDDFIAAAEWLILARYTSTPKLAIHGHSNGGLLVGAALTQRPDLFGAAVPGVGVMDMLRFHKFTIGWAWVSDYGSPDDPADFPYLLAYSPYQHIKDGQVYPPTLVTTADHDDRVFPAHSFKFAAALQHAQAGEAPTLIRIEVKAGHGAGKPISKLIEEDGDVLAFLYHSLDFKKMT